PDPVDPGSLLDHTVVLWSQELGHGSNHVCTDVPHVLAGAPGVLDLGQLLSFNGESHQRLLVAVAQAMGVNMRTFGKPQHTPGALEGVLKSA
ncbi:MAG: Tat (twin-arginine translocation) pathway signal sequence domain protein, partial [Myxococcota bacterium]